MLNRDLETNILIICLRVHHILASERHLALRFVVMHIQTSRPVRSVDKLVGFLIAPSITQ